MILTLRNISIRNKLILMQVFTSVLVLGIFIVVYVYTDIRTYKERKVDAMISLAQVIGTNSVSTLQFLDDEAAKQILDELHNVAPEIIHAAIINKKGDLFASYARPGAGTFSIPPQINEKKSLFTTHQLYVSNDIVNNNETIGKVILEVDLTELELIKQSKFSIATILLLVAIGVSTLVAFIVQRYISRRLLYLVDTMEEVSRTGDYSKTIADGGKDEISTLIKVYNNLMLQVKENQRRKDDFIGIASHELKTPLTSIKGYLELLNGMEDRQPNKQCVTKAMENVNKLERLIKELLDVSKIQSGHLELNRSEFNVDALLDETISSIQMVSKTHEIVRENKNGTGAVLGDRQRIEQVLVNLLSNAIKYSPGGRKIIINSRKTDKDLIIKVRDFGIGVPSEERSNIFERFYRTKGTPNHISGFGLGLYICRNIIDRHQGKIWLESEEKGTSFYFSLPLNNALTTPVATTE